MSSGKAELWLLSEAVGLSGMLGLIHRVKFPLGGEKRNGILRVIFRNLTVGLEPTEGWYPWNKLSEGLPAARIAIPQAESWRPVHWTGCERRIRLNGKKTSGRRAGRPPIWPRSSPGGRPV
jgi:hypothetical protein